MEQKSDVVDKDVLDERYIIDKLYTRKSRLSRFRPSIILRKIATLLMSVSKFMLKFEKRFDLRAKRIPDKEIRLHLGCGQIRLDGYINIDGAVSTATDTVMNVLDLDLASNAVDEIFSSHMIEHLTHQEFETAIDNWYKILKPGGILTLRCPNFIIAIKHFAENPEPERWKYINMIFGPTTQGSSSYNLHKNGFSVQRLSSVLAEHGFTVLKCQEVSNRSDTIEKLDLFCVAQKPDN